MAKKRGKAQEKNFFLDKLRPFGVVGPDLRFPQVRPPQVRPKYRLEHIRGPTDLHNNSKPPSTEHKYNIWRQGLLTCIHRIRCEFVFHPNRTTNCPSWNAAVRQKNHIHAFTGIRKGLICCTHYPALHIWKAAVRQKNHIHVILAVFHQLKCTNLYLYKII